MKRLIFALLVFILTYGLSANSFGETSVAPNGLGGFDIHNHNTDSTIVISPNGLDGFDIYDLDADSTSVISPNGLGQFDIYNYETGNYRTISPDHVFDYYILKIISKIESNQSFHDMKFAQQKQKSTKE